MSDSVYYVEVYYSGRVQQVGFRYKALQIAKEFEVSGTVQNLDDGRIMLEAEGREKEVLEYKKEIENQMEVFINKVEFFEEYRPAQLKGFIIR